MKYQQDRAWMEISLDAIEENYRRICGFIGPDRQIMAVIPLGFADGIRRSIAWQVPFLLHGKRVPILGKICMDYTTLDVPTSQRPRKGTWSPSLARTAASPSSPMSWRPVIPARWGS